MTLSHEQLSAVPRAEAVVSPKPENFQRETQRSPYTIPLESGNCEIKANVSLASYTSFRVGGPAEWFVTPRSLDDIKASFSWARERGLPITLLGAGSNLLVSDRGLPGLTIATRHLRKTHFDPENGRVRVAAGQSLARLAWQAAQLGWEGFEWAVGIPGTVGGAVVMNAGAHGSCCANVLVNAHVMDPQGNVRVLSPDRLGYAYRTSILQGSDLLVVEATFALNPGADPEKVLATTGEQLQLRKSTQPYHLPSCGSVFRNPQGSPGAGWLIEQSGLKGYQVGQAQVAERHANFILNCGGATASQIFELIRHVQAQVSQHWSLDLEPEVRILGEF